jgi:hypothetical protein
MCTRIPYKKLEIKQYSQLTEVKQALIDLGFNIHMLDQLIAQEEYSIIAYYCGLKCDLINPCIIQPQLSPRNFRSVSDITNNIGLIFIYANNSTFIYKFINNSMQQFNLNYDLDIKQDRPTIEEIDRISSITLLLNYLKIDINIVISNFHLYVDDYMYKLRLWKHIGNYMVYLSNIIIQNATLTNSDLFFEQLRQLMLYETNYSVNSSDHHQMVDRIRSSTVLVVNIMFNY